MYFPKLTAPAQRRVTVDRFLGLDRRAGSAMGCFQNMENLWSGGYPALETRPARGEAAVLSKPNGLTCRDALVWVDGTALYVGGEKTGLALSDGEKQLVNMGAYLLIWPDRKYINTQDLSDFGSMENRNVTAGEVTTALCRSGGEELGDYAAGAAAPDAPEAGSLWLDTSDAEPVMKRYDGSVWLDVENVCTKISAAGIGRGFAAGDGDGVLELPGRRVRRELGQLRLGKGDAPPLEERVLLPGETLLYPGRWRISCESCAAGSEIQTSFNTFCFSCANICGKLSVASRAAGDTILLHRRGGTRSVSKLLGEARIPVSQRAAVPVLRDGAGPLAVYGIGQSERAFPAPQEPFYKITISPISEEERE